MRWRYGPNRRGLGETMSRVRRFAVLDELTENGFDCSDRTARSGDELRELYFGSDFVVSPQGKGRTNYREWEALAAGAIPLVDWDPSPAMAELYEGLPVVRVRDWRAGTPEFLDTELARLRSEALDMKKLYLPYWIARLTEALWLSAEGEVEHIAPEDAARVVLEQPLRVHARPLARPDDVRRGELLHHRPRQLRE